MVVLELALTLVLLVGAGLMIRSFLKLYTLDIGIKTENLLTMGMGLSKTKYPNADARRAFYDNFGPRLASIPGVAVGRVHDQRAAVRHRHPPGSSSKAGRCASPRSRRRRSARSSSARRSSRRSACSCAAGAIFNDTDGNAGAETVIINERFAAEFFKNEDPIGRRIRFVQPPPPPGQPAPTPAPPVAGLAHHRRHQPDHPARESTGRRADQRASTSRSGRSRSGFTNLLVRSALPPGAPDERRPRADADGRSRSAGAERPDDGADARSADVAVSRVRQPVRDLRGRSRW